MMRLGRGPTLLVAFFLLTSAATAYAECAVGAVECIKRRRRRPRLDDEYVWRGAGARRSA